MKCPHCRKEIDADPNSPEALCLYLKKHAADSQKHYESVKKVRSVSDNYVTRLSKKAKKWATWAAWTEEQLENRKEKDHEY